MLDRRHLEATGRPFAPVRGFAGTHLQWAGFQFRGGGFDTAPWLDPPTPQIYSSDAPNFLPRLTPGPRR